MKNLSSSGRKLIWFCAGAFLLVLVGIFFSCTRTLNHTLSPKLTITFSSDGSWSQSPQGGSLQHGNRDVLEWNNVSGKDLIVCMYDTDGAGRAFVPIAFDVPNGVPVFAHVRKNATATSGNYEHNFAFLDATSNDDCPTVNPTPASGTDQQQGMAGPRTIVVR